MRIAFVLFDRMTALDFIGAYDPITRLKSMGILPDLSWDFCARTPEVRDDKGLHFFATRIGQPLTGYDLLVVPGGFGTRQLIQDEPFLDWLRTASETRLIASACTGALLLGAAGFLRDRRATTHPSAYAELKPYCRSVDDARLVDDHGVITARGVTASIDLGLYLVGKIADPESREIIARQMDYPFIPFLHCV